MRQLVITCEHAGNRVPAAYRDLFRTAQPSLASHRGWDPGSLALARTLQRQLGVPLFIHTVTRLLVEQNRSIGHARLFSEFTKQLDNNSKQEILRNYYYPYRQRVEAWIERRVGRGEQVVHVSSHSFTPQLNGQTRNVDVGLLYDPRRASEKNFCNRWISALRARRVDLRIRRNNPYLGRADGFPTYLRRLHRQQVYVGIELEINQALVGRGAAWRRLQHDLAESLSVAMDERVDAGAL